MELLPEDVVTDVLRRLPPRGLAVSRSVCREWRAIVDARCDLRTDLLPTKLGGIFVKMRELDEEPEFLARPSMARRIASRLEFRYKYEHIILDCCNGLLLLEDHDQVINPATRQWARLPPYRRAAASPDGPGSDDYHFKYLVFDPAISPPPHCCYEVLAMRDPFEVLATQQLMMGVYSSSTAKWEERSFACEEGSATTIACLGSGHCHAACLNRALYTYWHGDFIMRISLSNDKYKIISLPAGTNEMMSRYDKVYLGKSKNKIHFALVDDGQLRLQVWFLNESGGKTEWVPKHGVDLLQILDFGNRDHNNTTDRPWVRQYGNYYHNKEPTVDNGLDWDSDEDNALDIDGDSMGRGKCRLGACINDIEVFGFHPYKEILFLYLLGSRVVAYYFNASKIQDLGKAKLESPYHTIDQAFIYTPCWNRELFVEN